MNPEQFTPPSFWKRISAFWIDFVMLLGVYLTLGVLSEILYQQDAYPPPTGMQLYSERDFAVYWFFVRTSLVIVGLYLIVCYKFFGATLGQRLTDIRLVNENGTALTNKNIFVRILLVIVALLLIMVPGPVVAILFIAIGTTLLNPALSVLVLLAVVFFLFYLTLTNYQNGKTRTFKDIFSGTRMIDMAEYKKQIKN